MPLIAYWVEDSETAHQMKREAETYYLAEVTPDDSEPEEAYVEVTEEDLVDEIHRLASVEAELRRGDLSELHALLETNFFLALIDHYQISA